VQEVIALLAAAAEDLASAMARMAESGVIP
jgi:hypothetical protein